MFPDPDIRSVPGAFLEARSEVSSENKGKGMCGNIISSYSNLASSWSVLCVYGIMCDQCDSDVCSIMVVRNLEVLVKISLKIS